jgi:hypothetical protein
MAAVEFPPYLVLPSSDELLQGDIIDLCPCPIVLPKPGTTYAKGQETPIEIVEVDAIVVTQSCDIVNEKVQHILVCPVYAIEKAGTKAVQSSITKGHRPALHALPAPPPATGRTGVQVADFRTVYPVPKEWLRAFAKQQVARLRLLPPYREALSHEIGRYFSRVALPETD